MQQAELVGRYSVTSNYGQRQGRRQLLEMSASQPPDVHSLNGLKVTPVIAVTITDSLFYAVLALPGMHDVNFVSFVKLIMVSVTTNYQVRGMYSVVTAYWYSDHSCILGGWRLRP